MIYDDEVRRSLWVCLGALVVFLMTSATGVFAQVDPPLDTTTTAPTTTTAVTTPSSTTTTTKTSTTRSSTTTTSTTRPKSTAPVPPPASGPSQTLVPDLLGSIEVTTTAPPVTAPPPSTSVAAVTQNAAPISTQKNTPTALTLILATIAWLASLGGLLVYAEDRRSTQWKHLAR